MPVPQLEQLYRPLHVGQTAAPQLGVQRGVGAPRQPFAVHPGLDPPDLQDLFPGRPARREADAVGQLHEPGAELRIAGHVPGPQQRLRFPDLRPTRVVLPVRGETADQRALPAFRAQVGVHTQRRVGGRGGQEPAQFLGDLVRPGRRGIRAVEDEQDVRVGGVAQLVPAEPAHPDDGEAQSGAVGDDEGGGQRCVADVGERRPHGGQVELAEQIGAGDPEQFPAPQGAYGGDRRHRIRMPGGGRREPVPQDVGRPGYQFGVVGQ